MSIPEGYLPDEPSEFSWSDFWLAHLSQQELENFQRMKRRYCRMCGKYNCPAVS
jgi:hypothetical protein